MSIATKLSTNSIALGKPFITHILLVTVLGLMRTGESRGSCCGETLISIPQVCESQTLRIHCGNLLFTILPSYVTPDTTV